MISQSEAPAHRDVSFRLFQDLRPYSNERTMQIEPETTAYGRNGKQLQCQLGRSGEQRLL